MYPSCTSAISAKLDKGPTESSFAPTNKATEAFKAEAP
jgi:hypothetical protein